MYMVDTPKVEDSKKIMEAHAMVGGLNQAE